MPWNSAAAQVQSEVFITFQLPSKSAGSLRAVHWLVTQGQERQVTIAEGNVDVVSLLNQLGHTRHLETRVTLVRAACQVLRTVFLRHAKMIGR